MTSPVLRPVLLGWATIGCLALVSHAGPTPGASTWDRTGAGEALAFLTEDVPVVAAAASGLGFPFRNVRDLAEIRAFGISPWGSEEFHNGIDLIVDKARLSVGDLVPVLSPSDGVVADVRELFNESEPDPALRQWILVVIEIEPTLWVTLSFEPKGGTEELQQLQRDSIGVVPGQSVRRGEHIGDLVVGEGSGLVGSGLPHVDLRLVLKEAATTLDDLLTSGASHEDPFDLPTFMCAYDFSSRQARRRFARVLDRADPATQCRCACTPDRPTDCGVGCID